MKSPNLLLASFLLFLLSLPQIQAAETGTNLARQNYILNCQGCHLHDGSGSRGAVPRMTNFVGNFLRIEGGREFIVQVPGAANAPIDDQELADVMNWLLPEFSQQQLPQDFSPYTAAEIAKLRSQPLIDIQKARARLLERLRDKLGVKEDGLNDV